MLTPQSRLWQIVNARPLPPDQIIAVIPEGISWAVIRLFAGGLGVAIRHPTSPVAEWREEVRRWGFVLAEGVGKGKGNE